MEADQDRPAQDRTTFTNLKKSGEMPEPLDVLSSMPTRFAPADVSLV